MLSLLRTTGIPDDGAAISIAGCPASPFFLQHDYIKEHWQLAELPAEKLPQTLDFADKIREVPRFRQLAWHCYRYFNLTKIIEVKGDAFPDVIEEFGSETGILYLLVGLSMIPAFIERAKREGFPVKYGEAGAKRIGSLPCFYAQLNNGAFGIRAKTLTFLIHYRETMTWRIGRFDFVISI